MKNTVSVVLGAAAIVQSVRDKRDRNCFDRYTAFCETRLPGCGCDVVLLPEMCEHRAADIQPRDGPIARKWGALARRHGLFLIAPLAERAGRRNYNTTAVFSPAGRLVHAYRKVHLAPGERKTRAAGRGFATFRLPGFRAGILTCFDNQFPESSRVLAVLGARVIFFPSHGDLQKPHRDAARCLDSHIWCVSASAIDASCRIPLSRFEEGFVMDPLGRTIARTGPREGLAVAKIPLEHGRIPRYLSGNTLATAVDYLACRRPDAYRPLVS